MVIHREAGAWKGTAETVLGPAEIYIFAGGICASLVGKQKVRLTGASLVAQWLRVCLPMQGTRVRALVWEDPTCHGATKPVSHNY